MKCKHCGEDMVGFYGDDECSDCAWGGILGKASKAGREAVEKLHFDRTGEKKSAGEILRKSIGM